MGTINGSHARFLVSLLSHHKVKRAGSLAMLIWMFAVMWASDHPERDGRVPLDIVLDLLPDVAKGIIGERGPDGEWKPVTPMDVVLRAIEVGFFDDIEDEEGVGQVVPIHDFLDHNKSGAERAAESAKKSRAAGARHEQAPPTARDPGTGQFSSRRATPPSPHGSNHAERTETAVPTTTTETTTTTSVPTPRTGTNGVVPTDDDPWVTFGSEWEPIREAMVERGYRLPPTGGFDVEGTQRRVMVDLIRLDDAQTVAARMRLAPHGLRAPRPFADLVGWLLDQRKARADAIGPDPSPHQRERSSSGAVEPRDEIMSKMLGGDTSNTDGKASDSGSNGVPITTGNAPSISDDRQRRGKAD